MMHIEPFFYYITTVAEHVSGPAEGSSTSGNEEMKKNGGTSENYQDITLY